MSLALVLGGANCVWSDVQAALELAEFAGVVACNDVAALWPGDLDAMVTLHPANVPKWLAQRSGRGLQPPKRVIGYAEHLAAIRPALPPLTHQSDHRFPGQTETGSSGHFALKVALVDLGFDAAVLCGVPMNADGAHFFTDQPWAGAVSHRRGWVQSLPLIRDRARSMSGWTAELLGTPDEHWLATTAA